MLPIAAIILCGGEGKRIRAEGIRTHKPLLEVQGVPSTRFVIEKMFTSGLPFDQLLVVIPPSRVDEYESALNGLGTQLITQNEPLGTGDAVLIAAEQLNQNIEHIYVTFGTQPLVRRSTMIESLDYHLQNHLSFTLPTTIRDDPYAPLLRDARGAVVGSDETHLESADMPQRGETNVGAYWVTRTALERTLRPIADSLYDESNNTYQTTSGEFGFPNEMVRACLGARLGVDGVVCAQPEEVLGIKTNETLKLIEEELVRRATST